MLNKKAVSLSAGYTFASFILASTIIHLNYSGFADQFLKMLSQVYPGFIPGITSSVITGPFYGFITAVIAGFIFTSIYNFIDKEKN